MPGAKTCVYDAAFATPPIDSVALAESNGTAICCDHVCPDASLPVNPNTTTDGTLRVANLMVAVMEPSAGTDVPLKADRLLLAPLIVKPVRVVAMPASSLRVICVLHLLPCASGAC